MRAILLVFCAILFVGIAQGYQPVPVQKSAAEVEFSAAIEKAVTDSVKLALAKDALGRYPEDISLGRLAQDVILKLQDNPEGFFRKRAEGSGSIAAHYLYARATEDTLVQLAEAEWILAKDPQNFWGHQTAAIAEWSRTKPDLAIVKQHLDESIRLDPSRPEGYLNLAYLLEEDEKWSEAREVLEAGAIADRAHKSIRDARLTVYAELRDGDAFFKLMKGIYREEPLEADMPLANREGRLTTTELQSGPTVLEYWAYT